MCGIAGWVDWERDLSNEQHIVEQMGETMTHRGPDASGLWLSRSATFAHQRLIVVDPEGGAQPMTRTVYGHSYTIVYNGELYNTEDIRKDLSAKGHSFQSYSDTEVLLVAYIEWGTACVEHFNGIFAFGIWDESNQRLFLARDRLGVKPLFYARLGQSFLFASELKALLVHPLVSHQVDKSGLAEIFAIGPARTPGHAIFRSIQEVRAGHFLVATSAKDTSQCYWQLQSYEHPDDLEVTTAKVHALMVDAVVRQLVSDVPVATFLSGGLDSSVVSAIAARAYREQGLLPLNTYSIEFAEMADFFKANDFQGSLDAPWSKRVSESLGTIHHPIVFDTNQIIEALLNPLYIRDLPGMADIDTSLYLFCRRIKEDVTVALSGESADEIFGGYPWFHRQEALSATTFPWSLRLDERTNILSKALLAHISPYDYVSNRYQEALAEVPVLPGESSEEARIREISYLSITRFLPTLLDRKDRMSMGSGLEVRVPFCDHRIVDYVFNIPWSMKMAGQQSKGILRKAMKGYLPEDVLARKKSPYPSTPHPAYLAAVRQLMLEIVENSASPILPLINREAIRYLAATSQHQVEHRPWFGQIMATPQLFHYLIEVNSWLETYQVELV